MIGFTHPTRPDVSLVTIADGSEHGAETTGFHKRWWRQFDEDWPEAVREAYNRAFTHELTAARVAVVELAFDATGKWNNIAVIDLNRWEPTFPFDPATGGWVKQDPRSRVGWQRRSALLRPPPLPPVGGTGPPRSCLNPT